MNPARREPLLWLQLLGLAALPLEALLLFVVFAGADPGPFPGFERLLTWALGALGPAVLFWRLPPDLWSLLLVQVPLRGRRPEQLRLSALQLDLPLRLIAAAGAALLLPLSWWSDAHAGLAWSWSPLSSSPRLVVLLLCVPVLALMQWQWTQLVQALWMLTRPGAVVEQTLPLGQDQAAEQRLNLGLPLLLMAPLELEQRLPEPKSDPQPEPQPEPEPEPVQTTPAAEDLPVEESPAAKSLVEDLPEEELPAETSAAEDEAEISSVVEVAAGGGADVTVLPEQETEEAEGTNLDEEVAGGDNVTTG